MQYRLICQITLEVLPCLRLHILRKPNPQELALRSRQIPSRPSACSIPKQVYKFIVVLQLASRECSIPENTQFWNGGGYVPQQNTSFCTSVSSGFSNTERCAYPYNAVITCIDFSSPEHEPKPYKLEMLCWTWVGKSSL